MSSLAATVPFCAYGGQGVVPMDAGPDDYIRVIAVVDVTVTSPAHHVKVASLALKGSDGGVEATLRAPITIERIDPIPPTTSWATAMQTRGKPFDGNLAPGKTRIRIEGWLDRHPRTMAASVIVSLTTDAAPIQATGAVAGEWPTA